jgi:hypothetical protein
LSVQGRNEDLSRMERDLLEASFHKEVRQKSALNDSGKWVFVTKYSLCIEVAKRFDVISKVLAATENIDDSRWKIREQADSGNTRSAAARLQGFAQPIRVFQIRESDAGNGSKCVVTPSTGIDIEQFELPIARVELVLHFDQTLEIDCAKKSFGQCF